MVLDVHRVRRHCVHLPLRQSCGAQGLKGSGIRTCVIRRLPRVCGLLTRVPLRRRRPRSGPRGGPSSCWPSLALVLRPGSSSCGWGNGPASGSGSLRRGSRPHRSQSATTWPRGQDPTPRRPPWPVSSFSRTGSVGSSASSSSVGDPVARATLPNEPDPKGTHRRVVAPSPGSRARVRRPRWRHRRPRRHHRSSGSPWSSLPPHWPSRPGASGCSSATRWRTSPSRTRESPFGPTSRDKTTKTQETAPPATTSGCGSRPVAARYWSRRTTPPRTPSDPRSRCATTRTPRRKPRPSSMCLPPGSVT